MKGTIQQLLAGIVKSLGIEDAGIVVDIPEDSGHGDYTTNIAMIFAGRLKAPPMKIGEQIIDAIKKYQNESGHEWLERVEVVPPGFINLWLSKHYFSSQITEVLENKEQYGSKLKEAISEKVQAQSKQEARLKKKPVLADKTKLSQLPKSPQFPQSSAISAGKEEKKPAVASFGNPKTIMVEFAHPNTHKAFHIGHLRNITTGESIIRLLESQGNRVIRANYQGDVGMHIAKALYALVELSPFKDKVQTVKGTKARVEFLGKAYAAGSKAFEESDEAKKAIGEINKQIYAKDPAIYPLYRETRQWSLDYFDGIYKRIGSHFDRFYFESEFYELGKKYVAGGVKQGIFEESKGAIIFPGEKFGLHNRVFVTGDGNATYEGKEIGLGRVQFDEYHPDLIIHVVGPEQASYFQVLFKALEQVFPDTAGKEYHCIYGWVKLKSGKMSSRSGVVVLGEWLLDEAAKSIYAIVDKNTSGDVAEAAAIAAVKYAFLKVGTNQEIAFDLKESISFDGDSGPYLLYTYARCKSVLKKSSSLGSLGDLGNLNPEERIVVRRLSQFPEVVADAATRFAPNTLCTYLFHLAQEFNLFYAKHSILGDEKRIALTAATAQVLKNGLYLLGIQTVERM